MFMIPCYFRAHVFTHCILMSVIATKTSVNGPPFFILIFAVQVYSSMLSSTTYRHKFCLHAISISFCRSCTSVFIHFIDLKVSHVFQFFFHRTACICQPLKISGPHFYLPRRFYTLHPYFTIALFHQQIFVILTKLLV